MHVGPMLGSRSGLTLTQIPLFPDRHVTVGNVPLRLWTRSRRSAAARTSALRITRRSVLVVTSPAITWVDRGDHQRGRRRSQIRQQGYGR